MRSFDLRTTAACWAVVACLAIVLTAVSAVRPNDFKKCSDSSLCRRLRRLSSYAGNTTAFKSPYSLQTPTFDAAASVLTAPVRSALYPEVDFEMQFHFHKDGTARVKMDQKGETYKGWKRYDEAAKWAYERPLALAEKGSVKITEGNGVTQVSFGSDGSNSLEIVHEPFKATFMRDSKPQIVLNERGLLHMEHFRPKPEPQQKNEKASDTDGQESGDGPSSLVFQKRSQFEKGGHNSAVSQAWAGFEERDSGEWEETWSGRQDSKPKGPEGLSLDISFPGKAFLFGLPEHASPLNLRNTRGQKDGDFTDPYRLMNTDVFEYDYDSPMSLYGSVPVVHAQSASSAASAFFLTGAETWIDVDRSGSTSRTHWMAESGILDLLVMLEDTPAKNIEKFTELVGRTTAPPTFALGYHQCRWNYLSDKDVLSVQEQFDAGDIPMDVMWLDIEYSRDHMYGVWDELNFHNPEGMIDALDARARKLVIIMDPHLKRTPDYWLYKEAQDQDVLVKQTDGKQEYEGWCWSGSASWLDMFNPKATQWWKSQYKLDGAKIQANRRNMHIWNDMNEPAIFNGPEITSPKDVIHYGGWEHRDIHNINGILFQAATFFGLQEREGTGKLARRPFVLSRAWWVGTQKYGAIWTGDNLGTWEHLAVSVPMILANNVAGMSFCGADVGGFFGNPSPEMLVRWYQAGIFEPFFRAHAHIDTKRREPYLLEEPHRSAVRDLLRLRYKLLPMWTTAFREASDEGTGLPVLRPQFLMFPNDEAGLPVDDQYYIGDSGLLVKPAVKEGAASVDMYLADDTPYYNYFSHEVYAAASKTSRLVNVPAPLTLEMPLLQRGGSIVPSRERVRRAAELGWRDPITLVIALEPPSVGSSLRAQGLLYLDDGQTYHYQDGAFVWRRFTFETAKDGSHTIRSQDEAALRSGHSDSTSVVATPAYKANNEFAEAIKDVRVEKIVVLGLDKASSGGEFDVTVTGDLTSGAKSEASSIFEDGVTSGKAKKGKGKRASRLVIKDPKALIRGDWEIRIVPRA